MPQIETTHLDAERGEGAALLSPKAAKKSWSRAAPLVVLGASLLVLVGVSSASGSSKIILPIAKEQSSTTGTKPEMIKLPDLSDLADLGTDFLGGIFGVPTAPAVEDVDFDAYTGRWYNVYYNYPTLAFSQPDCATAFYGKITSAEFPAISVNNSGLCSSPNAIGCTGNPSTIDGGQTATYILGTASKDDSSTDGDLNLQFTGVPRASVYSIIKLGPKTFGAGYYEYAVVGGELFLYVLARDVDEYFEKYDDEVQKFLKKSGYKGLLLKPRKNDQDNCPDVIYEPNAFDPSTPPPVLAADQEASSSSCTRDAYGKCVPAGCASYFDGCNTCNVGAVLGCTMMFCDTPQEPKCLEYKKD